MSLLAARRLVATTIALVFSGKSMAAEPMTLHDYMALNGPTPSEHLAYGAATSQYVELSSPKEAVHSPWSSWYMEDAGSSSMAG